MKELLAKLGSRKLGATAVIGIVTTAGLAELTWPMAAVACAYLVVQAYVDSSCYSRALFLVNCNTVAMAGSPEANGVYSQCFGCVFRGVIPLTCRLDSLFC